MFVLETRDYSALVHSVCASIRDFVDGHNSVSDLMSSIIKNLDDNVDPSLGVSTYSGEDLFHTIRLLKNLYYEYNHFYNPNADTASRVSYDSAITEILNKWFEVVKTLYKVTLVKEENKIIPKKSTIAPKSIRSRKK